MRTDLNVTLTHRILTSRSSGIRGSGLNIQNIIQKMTAHMSRLRVDVSLPLASILLSRVD